MAKKLISVWLSLTIIFFSSISIYADENVQGDYFVKHVVINGQEITNENLQYPFFMYNDTTYFPLTPEMGEICGVAAEMDWESRTLKLLKTDSTRKNISSNWRKNNETNLSLDVLSGVKVLVYDEILDESKTEDTGDISAPELSVHELDLGGMPILAQGKYLFLPVRAMKTDETFSWDIYYNSYYGVCISTTEDVTAESYCDKAEVLYNTGLVAYMRSYNSGISVSYGQQLAFIFKRAAELNGIDEKLLMAIAHKESTFNAGSTARGGAVGLMQIMPSTGALFGVTIEQLYDARTNVNLGANYISQRVTAYNGDYVKGLSAYNQGSSKVNRGTHSTAYATRILSAYEGLNNFMVSNGYVAQ